MHYFYGTVKTQYLSNELAIYYDADWFWEINGAYKSSEIEMRNWLEQASDPLPANQRDFGASAADFVFARDRLADIFEKRGFAYKPWADFYDIIKLSSLL